MSHIKDDRRYESFETRAAYDSRYVKKTAKERTITCCGCGKTVTHVDGVAVRMDGHAVTCPRLECSSNRVSA
jgi:hypothetical protein